MLQTKISFILIKKKYRALGLFGEAHVKANFEKGS